MPPLRSQNGSLEKEIQESLELFKILFSDIQSELQNRKLSKRKISASQFLKIENFTEPICYRNQLKHIFRKLPRQYRFLNLKRVFCTKFDGISFNTLFNRIREFPCILLFQTTCSIYGVFHPRVERKSFGSANAFRFFKIQGDDVRAFRPKWDDNMKFNCEPRQIVFSMGEGRFLLGSNMKFIELKGFSDIGIPSGENLCEAVQAFILVDEME